MPSGPDHVAREAAIARQNILTKPAGALGRLETLVADVAAAQGSAIPAARPAACILFASDHPVTRHGVSAYPSEVTAAMVKNFADGGAAASVLSKLHRLPLHIVNVGVRMPEVPGVVRLDTADAEVGDLRTEDAMSPAVFEQCLAAGRDALRAIEPSPRVVLLGEMGIGNTTAASAVAAALLGEDPERMVGSGTGVDDAGRRRKVEVVRDALNRVGDVAALEPLEVLRRLGGRELVAIAGAALEAAERRAIVLVDGFIVSAALLALVHHDPTVRPYLFPAHRSREPGHLRTLEALVGERHPLLDLDLALGEGSGALVAYPVLEAALETHAKMATFEGAGVPDRAAEDSGT